MVSLSLEQTNARNLAWSSRIFLVMPASLIRFSIASDRPIPGGSRYSLLRWDSSGWMTDLGTNGTILCFLPSHFSRSMCADSPPSAAPRSGFLHVNTQYAIEYNCLDRQLAVAPPPKVSKLVITNDYRILLPDYYNIEIKLEPLVKAVYLLFLKHPEGIVFKDLTDYREELKQIYSVLRPNGITDKAIQSIEDLTNPVSNSINEKCARIRGVFVGHFGDDIAQHYYIDGLRGEPKKISLPRDLVIWETD